LTKATSTSSSLENLIAFQNTSLTGLNPANLLCICLLALLSFQTSKINLQLLLSNKATCATTSSACTTTSSACTTKGSAYASTCSSSANSRPAKPKVPEPEPVATPSTQPLPEAPHQHDLCPRPDINYKELHTGVKSKCCSLRRLAKAVVTKLAPDLFLYSHLPQINLQTQATKSHHLNLCNSMVLLPSTFTFFYEHQKANSH
jgi:hypothetical protein